MFVKQWLLAHEFALLDGPTLPPRLRALWRNVASELGMRSTTDVDALSLGDGVGSGALTVLALAQRPVADDRELYHAALSSTGDAACLTVLLAPIDEARRWASIDAELTRAEPDSPPTDLGSARVYVGLVDGPLDRRMADAIAPLLATQVPDAHDGSWTHQPSRTTAGFLLWEAPSTRSHQRRLVLVGPAEAEAKLDAFSWSPGGRRLGAFVQYLLDAAKLHHQRRIYQESSAHIRQLRQQTDSALDRLLTLHQATGVTTTDLVTADHELTHLQLDSTGVVTTHAQLRKVKRNTEAALDNLNRLAPLDSGWRGPLADDQAVGEALKTQVTDDITDLEIVRDHAGQVSAFTAAVVQRGLSTAQQQLLRVQSSIISAILTILAAVQAFETKLPIPDWMQKPLIFFLGGLALALPTAVLRWSRHVPQDLPLRWFDYVTTFLAGASFGWFISTAVSRWVCGQLVPVGWTLVISVACGILIAVGLAWLEARKRPGRRARSHDRRP